LTRLEARLLEYLMLNQGQVLSAENLIDHVWGQEGGNTEMLRQLVRRLRIKIENNPDEPALIKNRPGVGYGFGHLGKFSLFGGHLTGLSPFCHRLSPLRSRLMITL
jgi:DNA-binding response OmpR family regulator